MQPADRFFSNQEAFDNVTRGFMLLETMSPEWLDNFARKYGDDLAFDIDLESERLTDVIIETGNIRKFLTGLIDDATIIEALIPDKYRYVGMIDKWQDHFEIYADTWARMIKICVTQGLNILRRLDEQDAGMNVALDIDSFDVQEDRYDNDGENEINLEAITRRLGPDGMLALHALFHSMSLTDFHRFLTQPPGVEMPRSPMENVMLLTRLVGRYVRPKWQPNLRPPGPDENYNLSVSNKIEGKALIDLDLTHLNLN